MNGLKRFAGFWYDFIVGDDGLLAAGVIVGLFLAILTVQRNYWFMFPIVILGSLVISLLKATRSSKR